MGNKMSCSHLDSRSGAGSSAHLVPHRNQTTERLSMRHRQLPTPSVLAPSALVACEDRLSEASGGQAAAPNFTYSPEGYEGLTIELDRPVERIAADFYSAAGLAQYGITPVAVFRVGQNEAPGKASASEVDES